MYSSFINYKKDTHIEKGQKVSKFGRKNITLANNCFACCSSYKSEKTRERRRDEGEKFAYSSDDKRARLKTTLREWMWYERELSLAETFNVSLFLLQQCQLVKIYSVYLLGLRTYTYVSVCCSEVDIISGTGTVSKTPNRATSITLMIDIHFRSAVFEPRVVLVNGLFARTNGK